MASREERVRALVEFLCSPECAGRAPGTPGGAAARERVRRELEAAGLEPAGPDGGWLQPIPAHGGANVLGRLPGSGPRAERAVLVAAHYDHLGEAGGGACYWGADDNAAAVAVLVDVARRLAGGGEALDRQVLFCAFDAEEPPWFLGEGMGSVRYTRDPPLPLERIDQMICMDLVGHAVGPAGFPDAVRRSLFALGAELSAGTGELVDAAGSATDGLCVRRLGHDVIDPLSDYHAFHRAGVPFVFLTCGRWEHYHQTTDTPDRLDYPKVLATADFLADLVGRLSRRAPDAVPLEPERRDDAATTASLLDVARLLAPHAAAAARAVTLLEPLAARARADGLGPAEQALLPTLVAGLEQALA